MDIATPPPPLLFLEPLPTPTTNIPFPYNNGDTTSHHSSSPPPPPSSSPTSSSVVIVMIIISSAIIVSATIYFIIRFISRRSFRTTDDVVSGNRNQTDHVRHHVINLGHNNDVTESLPLFTFSSLTGKIAGGDCAVCLSKFKGVDQLRLLPLCCHAFHAECIDAWLKSNQTCPLCRSTVNPSDDDVLNKLAAADASAAAGGGGGGGNMNNSFRIEIGSISRRRELSDSGRRSYSVGSFEYVLDDGYEISVESTHRRGASECTSIDKDSTTPEAPGLNLAAEVAAGSDSGRRNWLRDYVDRVSVSLSSRTQSFRGSGRFFTGSSRRSEFVDDFEVGNGRIGEEISELFRWFSGL